MRHGRACASWCGWHFVSVSRGSASDIRVAPCRITHTALIRATAIWADHLETPIVHGFFAPAHVGITIALLVSGRVVCSDVQEVDLARRMAVFVVALARCVRAAQRPRLMSRMMHAPPLGCAQGEAHA